MSRLMIPFVMMCLAQPVVAFEMMLRSDCQLSLEKFEDLGVAFSENDLQGLRAAVDAVRVTPQGWCQIESRSRGLQDMEFDVLEWRAEGVSRWTRDAVPPLALQLRATGLDPDQMQNSAPTNRPSLSVDMTWRQNPDAGELVLEQAFLTNGAGDDLLVSGVFERVFLTSPSMMQISMGSVAFKAGLVSMTLTGQHENPFGFKVALDIDGTPRAQSGAVFDVISRLPDGLMDDASRAELTAYGADLPSPAGNLEVIVASERGLGLMQVGAAFYAGFSSIMNEETRVNEMEILLSGVRLSADWTPAAQLAD